MLSGPKVKWWEWLVLAVVVGSCIPAKRGLQVKWEWVVLAGVLSQFL